MLAGPSIISPNTVLFSMLLCPDLFRVSLTCKGEELAMSTEPENNRKLIGMGLVLGTGIGAIGIFIGAAIGNFGLAFLLPVGAGAGLAIGAGLSARKKQ